ncbi:MAG: hypothetical protein KF821_03055 [Anaerolineales bacterium]|jgi:hypothetical protein|nr:hypothetical protein [Anaerolineales bacterium]
MSFRRLLLVLSFLAVFAMALRISSDSDTWWHLRTGAQILQTGQVPQTDSYSHTRAGAAWLYPSAAWLSEIQMAALFATFGFAGLNLWVAALVTLAFGFVYAAMPRGGLFVRGALLVLAAASSAVYWAARPYLWSFVFSALTLWLLEAARRGQVRRLLWLPLVMLLWANSHPGFIVGFILLGVYALALSIEWLRTPARPAFAELWRRQGWLVAAAAAGMLLAVCLNPAGLRMLRYPFDTVGMDVLRSYIQEWQSPNFHEARIWPYAALFALSLLAMQYAPTRPSAYDVLLLGVLGALSLLAGRNIALFSLAAPLVLSRYLPEGLLRAEQRLDTHSPPTRPQALLNSLLLLLALAALAAKATLTLPAEANWRALRSQLPLGAVAYLQSAPPRGAMFNSYNWGGYLLWALPGTPVFADGRTDLYGDAVLSEWLAIATAEPGWQSKLAQRQVQTVLLEPSWALSKLLPTVGWQLLYEDEHTRLFERQ